MRWSRLVAAGVVLLALHLSAPVAAQEGEKPQREAGEVLSEIRSKGNGAGAGLFLELGEMRSAEALEALRDAVAALPRGYRASVPAFQAFLKFQEDPRLSAESIAFLYEKAAQVDGYPYAAALALGGFGEQAFPQLLDLLRKADSASVRAAALKPMLEALAAGGTEEGLELLMHNYAGRGTCTEQQLAELLARWPETVALPLFRDSIRDDALRREVRRAAVAAAATHASPSAIDFLRDCMQRRSPEWLQLAALRAAREMGITSHARDVARLVHASEPVLRFTALVEEGRLRQGEPEWEREVLRRVKSRSVLERQAAAATLGYLPRSRCFDPLMQLLDDRDHTVRCAALDAIEALRWYPTLEPLVERLEREDPVMRAKVHKALVTLTGRMMPPSPEMWRKWWDTEGAVYVLPSAEEAALAIADFKAAKAEADAGGTVSSFFGVPVISRRVMFVIDASGSMAAQHKVRGRDYASGMVGTRLSVAQAQLLAAIDALPDGDRFNVMFFESSVDLWSDGMARLSDRARRSVTEFVHEREPGGGTALYDALERIFLDFDLDVDTIYVLTDGQPAGGSVDDPELIREAVAEWNRLRHITIHGISIGGSIALLRQLSEDSGGEFREVK